MANVPEFGQLVEYVTEGPVIHPVRLAQHNLDALPVLQAIQADYQKVAALGRSAAMAPGDLDELRTAAGEVYHQDVIEHEIAGPDPAAIAERLVWVQEHALWHAGMAVAPPTVVLHDGNLYRCLQAHTTQADWSPNATPALWTRYYAPGETHAWVQPTGAHDAWPLGAQVTHNGHTWTSLIPDNVWEPGAAGSEVLWRCEDCAPAPGGEWVSGEQGIVPGDRRTYQGNVYECVQIPGVNIWPPPTVPALWKLIGPVE